LNGLNLLGGLDFLDWRAIRRLLAAVENGEEACAALVWHSAMHENRITWEKEKPEARAKGNLRLCVSMTGNDC
jgi:hypothetical protein